MPLPTRANLSQTRCGVLFGLVSLSLGFVFGLPGCKDEPQQQSLKSEETTVAIAARHKASERHPDSICSYNYIHPDYVKRARKAESDSGFPLTLASELYWLAMDLKNPIDNVTGFAGASERMPSLRTSLKKMGPDLKNPLYQAIYVEIDLQNLAGINQAMKSHGAANVVFRAITDLIDDQMKKLVEDHRAAHSFERIDAEHCHFRHGGDELSFLIGSRFPKKTRTPDHLPLTLLKVTTALEKTQELVKAYAKVTPSNLPSKKPGEGIRVVIESESDKGEKVEWRVPLSEIPHRKNCADPNSLKCKLTSGTGIYFGVSKQRHFDTRGMTLEEIDSAIGKCTINPADASLIRQKKARERELGIPDDENQGQGSVRQQERCPQSLTPDIPSPLQLH